jgi:Hsp20/alpha crystallin family
MWLVTLALAGFTPEQVTVAAQQNRLTVTGAKGANGNDKQDYIFQGIATRSFEQFQPRRSRRSRGRDLRQRAPAYRLGAPSPGGHEAASNRDRRWPGTRQRKQGGGDQGRLTKTQ